MQSAAPRPSHREGPANPSGDRMRHGRGGRKLKHAGPPSPLGESAAVGGGDASLRLRLARAGRSSPDLVGVSSAEVHAGAAGTPMTSLVPPSVARSSPRRHRGNILQEGHPVNSGECSESAVHQNHKKKKKTCRKWKRSANTDTPPAEPIPELSDEIVLEILVRLPVKSLLRCKSVCKGWRAIITDPFFVHAHLRRSASRCEQDPSLLITHTAGCHVHFYQWQQGASMATLVHNKDFGSESRFTYCFAHCDGLVLNATDTGLFLFNLATREAMKLPDRDRGRHHRGRHHSILLARCFCVGLGLDLRTGKHKVVRAFFQSRDPNGLGIYMGMEVFTVSGNSNDGGSAWREIKDDLPYPADNRDTGMAVNGFLFWRLPSIRCAPQRPWGLLRLNLANETFGITMLPDSERPDGVGLDVLHGELCMSARISKDTVTMWFLPIQEDGGQGQTWEQRYTVHLTCLYRPLAFLPGGRMMLYTNTDSKVRLYDVATTKLTTVCQLNRMKYEGRRARPWKGALNFNVHLYTESLVRIGL